MIRLFVALGLPDGLTQRLDGLHMALPGAHWVAPETMHVTLARCGRIREELAGPFLGAYAGFSSDPIRVDAFTLYSSHTGHDGPVYRPERRYTLSGEGADDVFNDDARFAELAAEWAEE